MKYELYHSPFLQFWQYQIWERKSEPMLLMLKKNISWSLFVADVFPSITFANKWHRALSRNWNNFGSYFSFFYPVVKESST